MNQGQRANKSGRTAENIIACVLESRGWKVRCQVPIGIGVYGHALRADFVVDGILRFPLGLAIESKWQDVSGSADEKLPYLVLNIQQCYSLPTLIVVHGGGIRSGAYAWVQAQVGRNLAGVMRLEEFVSWCSREP